MTAAFRVSPAPIAGFLVLACHAAPAPETTAPTRPYAARLSAPAGSTRWEPSGAAVVGDLLWVANDKDGVLAAYPLPLRDGPNAPVQSATVLPEGKRPKWEALRRDPAAEGRFLLLDTVGRAVWSCELGGACIPPVATQLSDAISALGPDTRLESLAPTPTHTLVGSRATPSQIADERGGVTHLGNLTHDGRAYQLSDALFSDGRFFLLWTYEAEGPTVRDVSGLLAVATPDAGGRPDPATLRVCRPLAGKPEGLDRWGDHLVVVFDQDDDRKAKGGAEPDRFELLSTEDFATVLPLSICN